MEIMDLDHAPKVYDTYSDLLSMTGNAIRALLDGKVHAPTSDELPRLEAMLRKTFKEAAAVSIMLSEDAIKQMPLLIFQPAKLAIQVKAQTRLSLVIKEALQILSRLDAKKPSEPSAAK